MYYSMDSLEDYSSCSSIKYIREETRELAQEQEQLREDKQIRISRDGLEDKG
jgi:hypothetical protein